MIHRAQLQYAEESKDGLVEAPWRGLEGVSRKQAWLPRCHETATSGLKLPHPLSARGCHSFPATTRRQVTKPEIWKTPRAPLGPPSLTQASVASSRRGQARCGGEIVLRGYVDFVAQGRGVPLVTPTSLATALPSQTTD